MIIYTRNAKGKYDKTGDLPLNTKHVQIRVGDRAPFGNYLRKEAESIIDTSVLAGQVRYESYSIVPAPVSAKMSEETKTKLKDITAQKKKDREERD
jgi:hypothetical protein